MEPPNAAELRDFDERWNYGRPAETAEVFRRYLEGARASGDADYRAQLLTQLARAQGLTQQFDDAHATLDEADALIDDTMTVARVRCLLERGRVLNSSGRPGEAAPRFLEAWEAAQAAGHDFHAVDAAHMMEIVATGEEKIGWNEAACEVAESSASEKARRWLGSLYNNRGWTLHELGRLEEALGVFERLLSYRRANDPREDQIQIARWSIAKTLRLLGRVDEALDVQRDLLRTLSDDGYVEEEMGECLHALGRPDEAQPHFARAHAFLEKDPWLTRNEPDRLARLERLGRTPMP